VSVDADQENTTMTTQTIESIQAQYRHEVRMNAAAQAAWAATAGSLFAKHAAALAARVEAEKTDPTPEAEYED
jgi:hypothetical protein